MHDLQEMIIHPSNEQVQEEIQMVAHFELEQQHEETQGNVEDNLDFNVAIPQINPWENFLHHEIPEDELMMDVEENDLEDHQNLAIQDQNLATQHDLNYIQPEQENLGQQQNLEQHLVAQHVNQIQHEAEVDIEPVFQNNIQLGMVKTFFNKPPAPYPSHLNPPWLAPKPAKKSGPADKFLIEIPAKWLGLFQALLRAPAQYSWAKQLILSGLPDLLRDEGDWTAFISMNKKPNTSDSCAYLAEEPVGVKAIEEAIQD